MSANVSQNIVSSELKKLRRAKKRAARRAKRRAASDEIRVAQLMSGRSKGARRDEIASFTQGVKELTRDLKRVSGPAKQSNVKPAIKEFERIAFSFAAPSKVPPERWSSEYSSGLTAICAPRTVINTGWNLNSRAGRDLADTDAFAIVRRDSLLAAIVYDANNNQDVCGYQIQFDGGDGNTTVLAPTNTITGLSVSTAAIPMVFAYATPTTSYAPHGDKLYPGILPNEEDLFLWIDTGSTGVLTTNDTAGAKLIVTTLTVKGGQLVEYSNTVIVGTGASQTTNVIVSTDPSGYYAFRIHSPTSNRLVTTFGPFNITDGGVGHFRHLALPFWEANAQSVESVRVLAAAITLTNEAADIYRNGKIAIAQMPQGTDWQQVIADKGFDGLARVNGADVREIKNGQHGWLKPTQPSDFDFKKAITFRSSNAYSGHFLIVPDSAFLMQYGRVDAVVGQSSYWTLEYGVEYQTTDPWRQLEYPRCDESVCKAALLFLKNMPQFSENPNHLAIIWDSIKNGVRTGVKYVANNPEKIMRYVGKGIGLAQTFAPLL